MPIYPYSFTMPPVNKQDIPSDGVVGEFLGISAGGVLDWLPVSGGGGSGDMLKADNLSGLTDYAVARTNIGLGTTSSPEFANLTLNSPSLSSSAPVTISQTWAGTGATAFTGLRFNAAGTSDANSASGSLLLDLQVGGVSKFSVRKDGSPTPGTQFIGYRLTGYTNYALAQLSGYTALAHPGNGVAFFADNIYTSGAAMFLVNASGVSIGSGQSFAFKASTFADNGASDTILLRDGAPNTLALRNGTAAQTFRVYGAYPDTGINYARLALSCDTSGNATISTQALGTYTAGTVSINGVPVGLGKGNVSSNISIGAGILSNNVSGSNNIGIGNFTLTQVVSSTNNTAIGISALQFAQLSNNIGIGYAAGTYRSIGGNNFAQSNNIYIGANTTSGESGGGSNEMVFGAAAAGIGSNSVVLGNDSITKTALKGNVGIGTTAPTTPLTIQANTGGNGFNILGSAGNFLFQSGGIFGASLLSQSNTSTDGFLLGTDAGASNAGAMLRLQTKGTVRAVIDYLGNVGIGTTTPVAKLNVAGGDLYGTFTNASIALSYSTTNQYSHYIHTRHSAGISVGNAIDFYTSAGGSSGVYPSNVVHGLSIDDGKVGIGTASPTSKLHVAGDVTLPNGGSIFFGGAFNIYGTTTSTTINGPTAFGILNVASNGVTKWTFNYDGLLCGGGTTAAFPALKRSSTTMQARLADDTAFAPIQGKLTTDTAFTATTVTPTGFITLYDSNGTAYKVPCVPA